MSLRGGRFHHDRRTRPGAPPGELASAAAELQTRGTCSRHNDEHAEEAQLEFPLAPAALERPAGKVTWIDLHGLGNQEAIETAARSFGLQTLLVADLVNARQRPKVEVEAEAFVVFARMVRPANVEELAEAPELVWIWEQVGVVCADHGVLTVQERYGDCLEPLRERIRQGRKRVRSLGSDYLAIVVLDAIVDAYFPVVESFGDHLARLEDEVLERPQAVSLVDVYAVRRELLHLRRAAAPLREALSVLERGAGDRLTPEARPFLADVLDHLIQVVDLADTYRDLTNTLIDVHQSSIANRTNEVMRVLAIVSTIFFPLSFLAGVYGMNFDRAHANNLPELGWPLGYVYFWALCAFVVVLLLWAFRKRGWLGRAPS